MDHYGDCLRRHHSSPVVSDGGIDEPRRNRGHNDFKRQEKGVQKLRHEEAQKESILVCLFTKLWQKFQCAVLTICTITSITKTLSSTGSRYNEKVDRWNNIMRSLASRYAGRMILMHLELELRAMDQARFTADGKHFDSTEGKGCMNRV